MTHLTGDSAERFEKLLSEVKPGSIDVGEDAKATQRILTNSKNKTMTERSLSKSQVTKKVRIG